MGQTEFNHLKDAFDSNWIAPLGPHVNGFEDEMCDYLEVAAAAALSSGTGALHLALKMAGVHQGDKVLCSSLTFAASANVIVYEKAEPVFIDSDSRYWILDVGCLETALKKHKPKALIAVDLYGQSCDYDAISDLCKQYQCVLIEDAAEALGSDYRGKKCGNFGEMAILSFNGNKIITTSGGGMLVSNTSEYVEKARFLSTQAREHEIHYEHKEIGYNYRMSNLLAAVGRGQLEVLDQRVARKREIFDRYFKALAAIDGINFMEEMPGTRSNRWLTTLTIDPVRTGTNRTEIIQKLESENIEARPVWNPMHLQPVFKNAAYVQNPGSDISAELFEKGICLPSGTAMAETDQDKVIDILMNCITKKG